VIRKGGRGVGPRQGIQKIRQRPLVVDG
jgi:hypothetical protein